MRPVVVQMGLTVDGFVHGAEGYENWGLPDEYRLVIHPVVVGHGTGLFTALRAPLRLEQIETRPLPSGTTIHTFRPRGGDR